MSTSLLLLLAAANFAVGMGALGVVGLVSPLAGAFGIAPPTAAWMVSLYAMVYAVSSPLLVALTGGVDRARVLVIGLLVFGAGALGAALAPDFAMLLLARAAMAIGGGLISPVAASVAMALTAPERRGRALSLVFGGLTVSQAIGVPICTWLGYAFGWQAAFLLVAALALPCALLLHRLVPRAIAVPATSLATLGTVLTTPRLLLALGYTVLFLGAAYALHTYLGPFAEAVHGLGRDGVTGLLLVFGLGAVGGNAIGGWLADRIGPVRTLVLLGLCQAAIMLPLTLAPITPTHLFVIVAIWSVIGWAFSVPQQLRLSALAPPLTPVLFALNAACISVGASLGGVAGGVALREFGYAALGPTGALLALLAVGSLWLVARMRVQPAGRA